MHNVIITRNLSDIYNEYNLDKSSFKHFMKDSGWDYGCIRFSENCQKQFL